MSVCGADAFGHPGPDEPELLDLIAAIQPVATCVPVGHHKLIAVFPGPQGCDRDANHACDGTDAVDGPTYPVHRPYPARWQVGRGSIVRRLVIYSSELLQLGL